MLELTTNHYLVLSFLLFTIGLIGVLTRRIAFSYQLGDLTGQIFAVFTIAVAAGEAAIGLGILLAFFRLRQTTELDQAVELQG